MPTQETYYLDAVSLGSASVVYTDANLSTVAPDGFYSDGFISREQVSGVLLPQTACPGCTTPCGSNVNASGAQGVYYLSTEVGTDTGAIIIRFDPFGVPDGIYLYFDTQEYNGVVSPTYGWLQGTLGLPTYIGQSSANCGIPAGSPYTLDEYEFNNVTPAPLGTTMSVPILAGQLQFTAGAPGNVMMVVPKTNTYPSEIVLQLIGPCSGTAFNVSVSCPTILTEFSSTTMFASSALACAGTIDQSYYVAHLNGSAGALGLYDLVFSDPNGEFKLAAGFYKTTAASANDWFQVDANGAIIAFGVCAPGSYSYNVGFGASTEDACLPVSTAIVTGNNAIFCNCTEFDGSVFSAAATGTYYVSHGGYVLQVSVTNGNTVAPVVGVCTTCATSYSFAGCGVSNSSPSGACSDAGTNPKVLYSNCSTLAATCELFFDEALNNPVNELYVFALSNWDMDGTGIIVSASAVQC